MEEVWTRIWGLHDRNYVCNSHKLTEFETPLKFWRMHGDLNSWSSKIEFSPFSTLVLLKHRHSMLRSQTLAIIRQQEDFVSSWQATGGLQYLMWLEVILCFPNLFYANHLKKLHSFPPVKHKRGFKMVMAEECDNNISAYGSFLVTNNSLFLVQ